jgi:hypothetical protein
VSHTTTNTGHLRAVFVSKEPSDGLEPSTPSLPLSKEGGTEGTGGKPWARRSRKKEESADEE